MKSDHYQWQPPSNTLKKSGGLWQPQLISTVSYPDDGNELCYQVEDSSYWFAHRNMCIQSIIRNLPPSGTFYDIGGGNGFVALGLQNEGFEVVLVEPGEGAKNAVKRGVNNVIQATLGDAGLLPASLPAAGAFDVVEHIEDDIEFLTNIRGLLHPGGRFYCTVPALKALWSDEDIHAGHYRRYSKASLTETMRQAGFEVEYLTCFFAWLTLPVFILRTLPFCIRGYKAEAWGKVEALQADHRLPFLLKYFVRVLQKLELSYLAANIQIPFGTSILCVARAPKSE